MDMPRPPVKSYQGDDPYIFVSYSHRNSAVVYRAVERLCAEYDRLWYDEGIEAGRVWEDKLEEKIRECRCVLAFVSADSVASKHVLAELIMARDYKKQVYPVYLEPSTLPDAISDFIRSHQAIGLQEAEAAGRWTGLMNALPLETRQFLNSEQQLRFLEKGLNDTRVQELLREKSRDDLGWCSVQRRAKPYDDVLQTCKMCGETDWFEAGGLGSPGPAEKCPRCGLAKSPGRARPWFGSIRTEGDNVYVECLDCGLMTEYLYADGPPILCPKCGRLGYE
jgi:hypothetical protein